MFTMENDNQWQMANLRLRQMVEDELDEGERIAWMAQPRPGRFALRALPAVVFGIPWTAFAIFWMCGASGFEMPDFAEGFDLFPLFGIPFVLIGLAMLLSPLWMWRRAGRTIYAITDRRAILFGGGLTRNIRSFSPASLGKLRRRQRSDGSGDIILYEETSRDSDGDTRRTSVGFFAIPDVRDVEQMLRELAAQQPGQAVS